MQLTNHPKSRQNDIVVQELKDEVLIYDLKTNKAFCLNQTAAFVWQHADGQTPVTQIAYLLQKKLRTPVDESVIWFALEQLEKDRLLESRVNAPVMFAGMNRRDLITTLGKSAAVALPLVMMITAPTAAAAQSGGTCRQTAQTCGSGIGACCAGNSCQDTDEDGITTCCRQQGQSCADARNSCCSELFCINGSTCGPRGGGGIIE